MKRIAILEFVGCQSHHLDFDYPHAATAAIDDISRERTISELTREGDSMLLLLASQFLHLENSEENRDSEWEVHCCRHENNPPPELDASTFDMHRDSSERIVDSIVWHEVQSEDDIFSRWLDVANQTDVAIVIAPEIDNELLGAVNFLRSNGVTLLNADSRFISIASDKALTARAWRRSGIRQPWTRLLRNSLFSQPNPYLDTDFPWTLKPRDGAGGLGVRQFDDFCSMKKWSLQNAESCSRSIAQPWMKGDSMSIGIVYFADGSSFAMPARQQMLSESRTCESGVDLCEVAYSRSGEDWRGEQQEVAENFAKSAIESIPGVPLGWLGIDFLCDGDPTDIGSYIAIEINPRLTSSFRPTSKLTSLATEARNLKSS